jgi:predicted N-acyltransferase
MKKILGLTLAMLLTVATFANGIVTYSDAATYEKSKTEGVFNFSFDSSFSIDEINKTANYYENYFSVAPVATVNGITVVIKLVEDNEMSRRVITRFFVSLEVKEILVSGKTIAIDDFIAKYIMN